MSGKYTEAQAAATKKYLKSLKSLSIRITEEEYEKYKKFAESQGESLRSFVLMAMDEKMVRDTERGGL